LKKVQEDIADAERMLKALIRSLEKKHLDPRLPESSNPLWESSGKRHLNPLWEKNL